MNLELSDTELIFLYGNLKIQLKKLESMPASLVRSDIELHKSIIKKMESAAPQLKKLPIQSQALHFAGLFSFSLPTFLLE